MKLSEVPMWGLVALALLVVVEITLSVVALVDLYRRPTDRVVFANKWVWLAIIVLLMNTLGAGAIIYLAAGRRPAAIDPLAAPRTSPSVQPEHIADALYGPRDPGTTQP